MQRDGLVRDQIAFVQKINPPWVYEVFITSKTLISLRRVFTIEGDNGQYVSFGIVDANQDYLLVHLFSTKTLKPLFRIYKRGESFLSIGHTEIYYSDIPDSGVFAHFVNVQANQILIKTSG